MFSLNAEKRNIFRKKLKSKRLQGFLPAVYYGKKSENQAIFISQKEFQKLFKEAGETSIIELIIDETRKNVLIHSVDFDPLSGFPRHADFLAVEMDEPIEAAVPLSFIGESEAVKASGGILIKVAHELRIKALPLNLPHELKVDISKLKKADDKILVSDVKIPKEIEILENPNEVIALIEMPTEEKAEEETKIDFEKIEATKEKKEEKKEEKNA